MKGDQQLNEEEALTPLYPTAHKLGASWFQFYSPGVSLGEGSANVFWKDQTVNIFRLQII